MKKRSLKDKTYKEFGLNFTLYLQRILLSAAYFSGLKSFAVTTIEKWVTLKGKNRQKYNLMQTLDTEMLPSRCCLLKIWQQSLCTLYLVQRCGLLYLHRGDVVPRTTELTKHKGVEIPAVLCQTALPEQDLPQVRAHRGVAPHPQCVSIHIFLWWEDKSNHML